MSYSTDKPAKKVTVNTLREMKAKGEKVTSLTAYDHSMAAILDRAGIDIILVGDSVGNVMLGYDSTVPVTMDAMLHHVSAVSKAVHRALVVADMPFMSYQVSEDEAVRNAGRFLKEAGAHAVKLEGGADVAHLVKRLVSIGIPVQGHIGLTPQSVNTLGGYGLQGKTASAAMKLIEDARALDEAGAFSIVLEKVPEQLAAEVTARVGAITIGIGAGAGCDGQVLVTYDMLNLCSTDMPKPRFVKIFNDLGSQALKAVEEYAKEVKDGSFPAAENGFRMNPFEEAELKKELGKD
ncbi:MAG TPA: 3-methyl-2-oxobutanoate hydroxymethyltransferase [Bacillota bacterium]|nr:3-methyl-2-oxobutanoate hydroxymethyltransferase [Bacillota bacterium]HOH09433.1 3-methyl-2-oxobutanoate hydroxymethyltransferase [Bacillota bacterium]HOS49950.1 3-methyl-2-oxobutanoate hydroxymethyltransferase [Bacillota bacterium]HOY89021.1 3-methyl-2-oxobutanoate hydroxymethyltransferase [Bacillota bacterium]HPI00986.1 3-methyl-2-oxobutanoate hydroxymethyltransferase [Bacillota bacterium]